MLAREWACLHTAHLPVPKSLAAKPCVSISSKLIDIKRLQVLHFGHLRKTGERGSYQWINMVAERQIGYAIGKSAGPVEASGAQKARLKDQRYIGE